MLDRIHNLCLELFLHFKSAEFGSLTSFAELIWDIHFCFPASSVDRINTMDC